MVGCTKCGRNIPGFCRWCPGCGEEVWPLLLTNRPDSTNEIACPNCGTLNSASAENCLFCGALLSKSRPTVIGENPGQGRGGRISLNPNALGIGETPTKPPLASTSGGPQPGG